MGLIQHKPLGSTHQAYLLTSHTDTVTGTDLEQVDSVHDTSRNSESVGVSVGTILHVSRSTTSNPRRPPDSFISSSLVSVYPPNSAASFEPLPSLLPQIKHRAELQNSIQITFLTSQKPEPAVAIAYIVSILTLYGGTGDIVC